MMALLREKWQQLSNEEKEPFEKRALADKALRGGDSLTRRD
jgi:hypothetical protein